MYAMPRLFTSFSIPIKNRNNVCQDCLFHLAYLSKIEIYAKISFSIHIEIIKKV